MHILAGKDSSFNKLRRRELIPLIYQKVFLHSSDGKAFPESSMYRDMYATVAHVGETRMRIEIQHCLDSVGRHGLRRQRGFTRLKPYVGIYILADFLVKGSTLARGKCHCCRCNCCSPSALWSLVSPARPVPEILTLLWSFGCDPPLPSHVMTCRSITICPATPHTRHPLSSELGFFGAVPTADQENVIFVAEWIPERA